MKKYKYVKTEYPNDVLTEFAAKGWTVHTLFRNQNTSFVDILFEYEYGPA